MALWGSLQITTKLQTIKIYSTKSSCRETREFINLMLPTLLSPTTFLQLVLSNAYELLAPTQNVLEFSHVE
jgi:hypothetical protein